MKCREKGCENEIEANASIWFSYDQKLGWSVYGIGDEAAEIQCPDGHDNYTDLLAKELSAFIEYILPGTTWAGSDPQRGKGG